MVTSTTITVQQIHCAGCANTIRIVLGRIEGVRSIRPDIEKNAVTVAFDEATLSEADIRDELAVIGFDPID